MLEIEKEEKANFELSKLAEILNTKGKIIGVKDGVEDFTIKNYGINSVMLFFISFTIFIIVNYLYIEKKLNDNVILYYIYGFSLFGSFLSFVMLISEKRKIKVRFYKDGKIQINRFLINYKNVDTKLELTKNNSTMASGVRVYYLYIIGEKNTYKIELKRRSVEGIEKLINSLIFE